MNPREANHERPPSSSFCSLSSPSLLCLFSISSIYPSRWGVIRTLLNGRKGPFCGLSVREASEVLGCVLVPQRDKGRGWVRAPFVPVYPGACTRAPVPGRPPERGPDAGARSASRRSDPAPPRIPSKDSHGAREGPGRYAGAPSLCDPDGRLPPREMSGRSASPESASGSRNDRALIA